MQDLLPIKNSDLQSLDFPKGIRSGMRLLHQVLSTDHSGNQVNLLEYSILLRLVSERKMYIRQLADELNKSHWNTGRMVDLCERRGLIYKTFAGRTKYIILTEKGVQINELFKGV